MWWKQATTVTKLVIGMLVLRIVSIGLLVAVATGGQAAHTAITVVGLLFGMVFLAGWVLPLYWLHVTWRRAESRAISQGVPSTLGDASPVLRLFIPLYSIYWVFAGNLRLCDALDSQMIASGRERRAPRAAAITGGVMQLIPYVNILLAPFAWATFMVLVDRVQAELDESPEHVADVFT